MSHPLCLGASPVLLATESGQQRIVRPTQEYRGPKPGHSECLPQGHWEKVYIPDWGLAESGLIACQAQENLTAGEKDAPEKQNERKQKWCLGGYGLSWRPWFLSLRFPELRSFGQIFLHRLGSFNKHFRGYKLVRQAAFLSLTRIPCPMLGSSVRHTAGKISRGQVGEASKCHMRGAGVDL